MEVQPRRLYLLANETNTRRRRESLREALDEGRQPLPQRTECRRHSAPRVSSTGSGLRQSAECPFERQAATA